jgi:hypothetical protein
MLATPLLVIGVSLNRGLYVSSVEITLAQARQIKLNTALGVIGYVTI